MLDGFWRYAAGARDRRVGGAPDRPPARSRATRVSYRCAAGGRRRGGRPGRPATTGRAGRARPWAGTAAGDRRRGGGRACETAPCRATPPTPGCTTSPARRTWWPRPASRRSLPGAGSPRPRSATAWSDSGRHRVRASRSGAANLFCAVLADGSRVDPCVCGGARRLGQNDHRRPERVAIAAVRDFPRISGSPRNRAASGISDCSRPPPCMSGHCGFGRLQPPATVGLCPARLRLRALGLELKRFQNAYGAPPPRLDGRIVGIGTPASLGPWIQGRVRCLRLRILRTGPTCRFSCRGSLTSSRLPSATWNLATNVALPFL